MSTENIQDEEELKELREDTKKALSELWEVNRIDWPDGALSYEVISIKSYIVLATIDEENNPCAKTIADQIVFEHNGYIAGGTITI